MTQCSAAARRPLPPELPARLPAAQGLAGQEQAAPEQAPQEQASQDQASRGQAAQELASQEQTSQEQTGQELAEALSHHAAGRLAEAEALYRRLLDRDPAHPDALLLLGTLARQSNRQTLAQTLAARAVAVAPDTAAYQANLGKLLQLLGQDAAALPHLRRAAALAPAVAETQHVLGGILLRQGDAEAAAACFRAALHLKPDYAKAHNGLGNVLHTQGRMTEAAACYRQALALQPDYAEALGNLGGVLRRLGEPDAAASCLHRAIALNPALELAHFHLAEVLREHEQFPAAVASYRRALALNPDRAVAHHNLGAVHQRLAQPAEAADCFRAAIRAQPQLAEAHNNLGMALLTQGAWAEGWREHEWRWQVSPLAEARRDFSQPQWRGEPAAGRTLLVHAEQGYGDTLQFCRLAPLARQRGLRVIVEVPPALVRLLHGLRNIDGVAIAGEALPPFDLHCPMLSLPTALGITLDTIPATTPYLYADAQPAAVWRQRLAAGARDGPSVGLVWAGSPRSHWPAAAAIDRRRSLSPGQIAPLLAVPGLRCFSLQKTEAPEDSGLPLIDPMAAMRDFADTAALVANLDLVVAVDTAVAHLAGALGRPVWLLDRFDHCWRWLAGRDDSPWYPAMHIYRQPAPGDWDSVIAAVARDLRLLAEAWQAAMAEAVPDSGMPAPEPARAGPVSLSA